MGSLPNELQQSICHFLLTGPAFNVKVLLQLIKVNKQWADFVCNHVYRHYRISKYLPFIGFYNTVVSKRSLLPYGEYIRSLDMTAINKYGVDMRAHALIKCCPNLQTVTLGHPTSLRPATIQWMARHCKQLRTLSIGALESFPFMMECDFSSLTGLTTMIFTTTPLHSSSLLTLPRSLQELHLVRMDALDTKTMTLFFDHHQEKLGEGHDCITRLALHRCPQLLDDMTRWLPLHQLKWFSLSGPDVNDGHVMSILSKPGDLDTLVLDNTQVTMKVLDLMVSASKAIGVDKTRCHLRIKAVLLTKNFNIPRDKQGLIKIG